MVAERGLVVRLVGLVGVLAGVLVGVWAGEALGQTPVGGAITFDTTWTPAGSPFVVASSVRVTNGATLFIEPGVRVDFQGVTSLTVEDGTLVARGTDASPVLFVGGGGLNLTSGTRDAVVDPTTGAYVSGTALEHVRVEGANAGTGAAVEVIGALPLLRHLRVQDTIGTGVGYDLRDRQAADVRIEDVSIFNTTDRGLAITGGRSVGLVRVRVGGVAIPGTGGGAAMFLDVNDTIPPVPAEPDIVLTDCAVLGAQARWGIFSRGSWIRTTNLVVEDCTGIGHQINTRRYELTGCRYSDNQNHLMISGPGEGGFLRSGVFGRGGRVGVDGPTEVTACRFEDNPRGPVLNGRQAIVRDCVFLNNASAGNGGAIGAFSALDLFDNHFEGNSALRGGAVYATANMLTAGNTFVRNSAQFGGAVWLALGTRRSILGLPGRPDVYRDNVALESGGAVYVVADAVDFAANVFEGNEALFGGAIAVDPLGSALNLNAPEGGAGNRIVGNRALVGAAIHLALPGSPFPVGPSDARCVDWGTTDPAAIAGGIHDAADDPALPAVLVDPIGPCMACPGDFDGDGVLTLFDFLAFQTAFGTGDARADLDGDGDLTVLDFLEFQNRFGEGCP